MMTCQELTELVTDFLERRLTLRQRVRFQLHLGACRGCRGYLRQMKATVRLTGRLPAQPFPPVVAAELLARFRTFRR
jgi:predicted anti-sigma-YlaC factor YlaD